MPAIRLVEASSPAERARAFDVRRRVFVGEQGIGERLEFDADDAKAAHLLALLGEEAVGTLRVRLIEDGRTAKIERVAVLAGARGTGIGLRLVQAALDLALRRGAGRAVPARPDAGQGLLRQARLYGLRGRVRRGRHHARRHAAPARKRDHARIRLSVRQSPRPAMIDLVLAAAFLLVSHYGISSTPLRAALVQRIGEKPYLALYSLIALAAIVWLSRAYVHAPYIQLWPTTLPGTLVPVVVLPFALILLVAGVSGPNPTSVGQGGRSMDDAGAVRSVLRVTRHPVMWAIALWALSHIPANGDLASLVFFGALAALALIGTLLLDAKYAARRGAAWRTFSQATSNLPSAAMLAGRQRFAPDEIGWTRIALALVLYAVLLGLHPWLFGVSALGRF
jgi:uncharacterized membrane protein/predicted GNAT family N-acyltransferase